jgi:hypothetical protein
MIFALLNRWNGGSGKMKRVSDAPGIMSARYKSMKRIPVAFKTTQRLRLSEISPDRYVYQGHHSREPPSMVEFATFDPRIGWRWTNAVRGGGCEIVNLALNSRNKFYRGFLVPPTVDEYRERNAEVPLDRMLSRFGGRSLIWYSGLHTPSLYVGLHTRSL